MNKVKIGYCIVFIIILCLVVFYFPISIENIKVFNNLSIQRIYINNYTYNNKYNASEIDDKETIDEFIKFLNRIKIQRRLNSKISSYKHNKNGEYNIIITDENKSSTDIILYNKDYIEINGKLYKVTGSIDYNILNSFIKNNGNKKFI